MIALNKAIHFIIITVVATMMLTFCLTAAGNVHVPDLADKSAIPKLTFPGITQSEFEDAFTVLEEATVYADDNNPVYGFIYPFCGPGGSYGECWWQLDTSLALSGAKWVDQTFAENVLRNFIIVQRDDGRIPLHGPDTLLDENNKCSSLPKLFQVSFEVLKRTTDRQLILDTYEMLKKYMDWWLTVRKEPETGLIMAIVEEWLPGSNTYLAAIETNVEIAVGCNYLAQLAQVLEKDDDYEFYISTRDSIKTTVNTYLWNAKRGCFMNYEPGRKRFIGAMSVVTFDTFKLNIADQSKTDQLLSQLTDESQFQWDSYPLTSANKKGPYYTELKGDYAAVQWNGSIWSLRNYSVIEGLNDIGRFDLSAYLSLKTVRMFNNNYSEFLHPPDGTGQGVLRYSWTASQYIQIIIEEIFGVDYNLFDNTLYIKPNLDPALEGNELSLKDLLLPNGNRLQLTVLLEQGSYKIHWNITGESNMGDMTVDVKPLDSNTTYIVTTDCMKVKHSNTDLFVQIALALLGFSTAGVIAIVIFIVVHAKRNKIKNKRS